MNANPDLVARVQDFARRLTRDGFRFAVGIRGGHHSGIWSAWGNKNDYYLGARSFLGSQRISLHQSLICRMAFTEKHMAELRQHSLDVPADRASVKWRRLAAPEDGAIHVVSLIFPTDYFRLPHPQGTYRKPVLIIDAAPPGKAIEFGFFFTREVKATVEPKFLRIGQPLIRTMLDNGETVWVVARETELDREAIPSAERWAGNVRFHHREAFLGESVQLDGLTSMLWNTPKDGESLGVIEIGGVTASTREGKPIFRIEPAL
jgi:hypothetical protein